jgi:hypothetical protein
MRGLLEGDERKSMEAGARGDSRVGWTGGWNFGKERSIRFGAITKGLSGKRGERKKGRNVLQHILRRDGAVAPANVSTASTTLSLDGSGMARVAGLRGARGESAILNAHAAFAVDLAHILIIRNLTGVDGLSSCLYFCGN